MIFPCTVGLALSELHYFVPGKTQSYTLANILSAAVEAGKPALCIHLHSYQCLSVCINDCAVGVVLSIVV